MLNRLRTLEVFGYDINPDVKRRTDFQFVSCGSLLKKNLKVVDNCPSCRKERQITLRASRKNRACSKCFHSTPEMQSAKKNQNKIKTAETRQKMSQNHWLKRGGVSPFKGKKHTESVRTVLALKTRDYIQSLSSAEITHRHIKSSCTLRRIPITQFAGWATRSNLRARGHKEYKTFDQTCRARDIHCQYPGCSIGDKSSLSVHHKDAFHWCVERRHDPLNGVTLCHTHHKNFHDQYGRMFNTEAQFNEWLRLAEVSVQIDA